ncbi:hypothetical protein ES319_A11G303200v1 [Gossypium barbadense]|uniref:Uncharacterized protein n=1 Tax=Gossypium barbadense TaxID=3634 RepID=A0A5J5TV43_GOSBA|nr:hypothetical protein ES319_A11G303200v1 [Gossypium barbadense]
MEFALNKIDKHWDNNRSLNQHMNDLKRKVVELNGMKEDTDSRMSAELLPRKKLKREVQIWLENVERINGEVQSLDGQIGESSRFTRGFHADDVLKRTREVEELIQRGKLQDGLVVDDPQLIGQALSTTTLSGEGAKATVSKEMSIAKLQKDIASQIKVNFCDDECETRKAGMLFERLSGKSRFVVILDDIWEEVSLEKVRILEPSTGSKLVLTTRSFDVCRKMSCRAIKVKPLVEKESWKLFSEKVGRDILNVPGVEPIAKKIAKRCAGLPLGVITVASSMKNVDDLCEWRNALKELSDRKKSVNGLEEEVFQQLRFSYDRLKDPKLQHCFLSCALYPEDSEVEERELVQLWIAEGLVEEMDSRQAEFDRGRAIMNKLKNNCLLEDFSKWGNERRVKMHDLVRDMALHITSANPRFLVKAGKGLMEPPNVQEWSEDLEKVSLMRSRELEVLYPLEMSPPKCPMLTTLLLPGCGIKSIPEGFFNHMDGLKILKLSLNPIKSLPNSISNLNNLTALLLAYCDHLDDVSYLSKLRVLKELDLEGTAIKEVPHGMQNLSSLKYLNLDNLYTNVNEIPSGILSRLSCLQDLNVGRTLISGKEVSELKKLETFKGSFYDFDNLNMYLQAFHGREDLIQFIILVGKRKWKTNIYTSKRIELWDCDIYPNRIMLPRHIEELHVFQCAYYGHEEYPIFSRFVLSSLGTFSSLKYLVIWNIDNVKKLFSPNSMPLNLKELKISECWQLEEIIASEETGREERGRVTTEFCLPELKNVDLEFLPELKSICSVDAVVVCESLEWFKVTLCPELKRMPLKLPQVLPSSPPKLRIYADQKKWWESVKWDDPDTKSLLKPIVSFVVKRPERVRMLDELRLEYDKLQSELAKLTLEQLERKKLILEQLEQLEQDKLQLQLEKLEQDKLQLQLEQLERDKLILEQLEQDKLQLQLEQDQLQLQLKQLEGDKLILERDLWKVKLNLRKLVVDEMELEVDKFMLNLEL